jgi:cell division protein FtsL
MIKDKQQQDDDLQLEVTTGAEMSLADAGEQYGSDDKQTDAGEKDADRTLQEALKKIEETAREEDPRPSQQLTLRTILGGDLLSTQLVRSQIWLFILIVFFAIVYVAFRYQCQQDLLTIDRMEGELKDAKFKALSSSSTLTERCRESKVLDILKLSNDSLLHQADQPPYIIEIPE